jgi:lipoate---protein ligase
LKLYQTTKQNQNQHNVVKYLDLTFSDPASNLACDEALLQLCENGAEESVLRVWEPADYFVVVGYSIKVLSEVNVGACDANGIPIFRRFTGGGSVLQGPGCLNYSLVVSNERLGIPADLTDSYRYVLSRHLSLYANHGAAAAQIQGVSDLALHGRKFSGNAQHRKRLCSLFHGTFLLHFDIALIETCLLMPSRQPAYRHGRSHATFLCNLSIPPHDVREALRRVWEAEEALREIPFDRIETLVGERYSRQEWNFKY